jgi:hypothetical protein
VPADTSISNCVVPACLGEDLVFSKHSAKQNGIFRTGHAVMMGRDADGTLHTIRPALTLREQTEKENVHTPRSSLNHPDVCPEPVLANMIAAQEMIAQESGSSTKTKTYYVPHHGRRRPGRRVVNFRRGGATDDFHLTRCAQKVRCKADLALQAWAAREVA